MNSRPIVIFSYNRPLHLREVMEAVVRDGKMASREIKVFIDGPRGERDISLQKEIGSVIDEFSSRAMISPTWRATNLGLRKNIVEGLNEVFSSADSAIILEDDIVPNEGFFEFMDAALDFYQTEHNVWHINGYAEPLGPGILPGLYFSRQMHCWGWATWADRWAKYDRNPEALIETQSPEFIFYLDINGTKSNWGQVVANAQGEIDSWAIFWMTTILKHSGLCLSPGGSLVTNIGFDGTGTHYTRKSVFKRRPPRTKFVPNYNFASEIVEDFNALERLSDFYRRGRRFSRLRALAKQLIRLSVLRNQSTRSS